DARVDVEGVDVALHGLRLRGVDVDLVVPHRGSGANHAQTWQRDALPLEGSGGGVEGVEVVVVGAHEDRPAEYWRGAADQAGGGGRPSGGPSRGIEGVERRLVRTDVDD